VAGGRAESWYGASDMDRREFLACSAGAGTVRVGPLRYFLDPARLSAKEIATILNDSEEVADLLDPEGYRRRVEASTFPGDTFCVLKE
jgi:hypothetical protein